MPDRGSFALLLAALLSNFAGFYFGGAPPAQPATAPAQRSTAGGAPAGSVPGVPPPQSADAPKVELLIAPSATATPGKDGVYHIDVLLRKGGADKDQAVTVMAEWTGVSAAAARPATWTVAGKDPAPSIALKPGTLAGAVLDLGQAVTKSEKGYVRLVSCVAAAKPEKWTPANASWKPAECTRLDQPLELVEAAKTAQRPEPFQVPAVLAVATIVVALLVLFARTGIAMGRAVDVEWNIGDSIAANLNVGTTIITSLAAIGLSFEVTGSKYTKTEYTAWIAFYALCTALSPIVFGLLKTPDASGKPTGSLAGFLTANLLNFFGVFGQLFLAYELLSLLPQAKLVEATAGQYLKWLPVILALFVVWYAVVYFLSVRKLLAAPEGERSVGSVELPSRSGATGEGAILPSRSGAGSEELAWDEEPWPGSGTATAGSVPVKLRIM